MTFSLLALCHRSFCNSTFEPREATFIYPLEARVWKTFPPHRSAHRNPVYTYLSPGTPSFSQKLTIQGPSPGFHIPTSSSASRRAILLRYLNTPPRFVSMTYLTPVERSNPFTSQFHFSEIIPTTFSLAGILPCISSISVRLQLVACTNLIVRRFGLSERRRVENPQCQKTYAARSVTQI